MAGKGKRDFTQVAHDVFMQAVGKTPKTVTTAKQASGRKGGLKGGASRALKLTAEKRKAIATKAAATRWGKKVSSEA